MLWCGGTSGSDALRRHAALASHEGDLRIRPCDLLELGCVWGDEKVELAGVGACRDVRVLGCSPRGQHIMSRFLHMRVVGAFLTQACWEVEVSPSPTPVARPPVQYPPASEYQRTHAILYLGARVESFSTRTAAASPSSSV